MTGYSTDLPKGRAQNSSRAQSFMFFRWQSERETIASSDVILARVICVQTGAYYRNRKREANDVEIV